MIKKAKYKTLDDLVVLMQKEFISIHNHLGCQDQDMNRLREEITEIKMDLEGIKLRMGEMHFGLR